MIKDRPHDRAVEVIVITPDGVSVNDLQELAEKAWQSVNKSITIGGVPILSTPTSMTACRISMPIGCGATA